MPTYEIIKNSLHSLQITQHTINRSPSKRIYPQKVRHQFFDSSLLTFPQLKFSQIFIVFPFYIFRSGRSVQILPEQPAPTLQHHRINAFYAFPSVYSMNKCDNAALNKYQVLKHRVTHKLTFYLFKSLNATRCDQLHSQHGTVSVCLTLK